MQGSFGFDLSLGGGGRGHHLDPTRFHRTPQVSLSLDRECLVLTPNLAEDYRMTDSLLDGEVRLCPAGVGSRRSFFHTRLEQR